MPHKDLPADPRSVKLGHELRDASARGVAWVALSLLLGAVLMHAVLAYGFHSLKRSFGGREPRHAVARELVDERRPPPEPRLQLDPAADLRAYEARKKRELESYEWADHAAGTARIPVDRAMELLSHER